MGLSGGLGRKGKEAPCVLGGWGECVQARSPQGRREMGGGADWQVEIVSG